MIPLVSIKNLTKIFHDKNKKFLALDNISLDIYKNECLGLIGSSGSGKSTLAFTIMELTPPSSGEILFSFPSKPRKYKSQNKQIIFQNPSSALNPFMRVNKIIQEPLDILKIHTKTEKTKLINDTLKKVDLNPDILSSFPCDLSGGQQQRVCIARALITKPSLLICDEPLSSLDSCNQFLILNLLKQIKKTENITILFITHDITSLHFLSDRVAVMHKGKIVESIEKKLLFKTTQKETLSLLKAVPSLCLV